MQAELQFMVDAKERERLLQAVEFPGKRNRTLLAALLRSVASFKPGKCQVSQAGFGRMFKVERKTIQRAFAYLSSDEMNLIAIGLVNVLINGEPRTLNTYSVNWPALKDIVSRQSAASKTGPDGKPEPSEAMGQLEPTVGTVRADRWDSYARPLGHLGPTDGTSECPTTLSDFNEQLTTDQVVGVVGDASQEWTQEQTQRVQELLVSSGCEGDVSRAIAAAVERGWSFPKALEVIEQREPDRPGWLFNWFYVDDSLERHLASKSGGGGSASERPNHQRGDAMTREQQRSNRHRDAVVRHLNRKIFHERGPATEAEVEAGLKLTSGCASTDDIAKVLSRGFAACS